MDFNTNNGVFEPAQPSTGEKKVNPIIARGGKTRPVPIHTVSPDVIGITAIAVEIILLFLFRDAIFYNIIQPVLVLIADIIAVVLYIAGLVLAGLFGFRSLLQRSRRNRERWWF